LLEKFRSYFEWVVILPIFYRPLEKTILPTTTLVHVRLAIRALSVAVHKDKIADVIAVGTMHAAKE